MKTLKDLIEATQTNLPKTVKGSLIDQAAEAIIKDKEAQAVETCKSLIVNFEGQLKVTVESLRIIRAQEKETTNKVRKFDRAFRFFAETGNPFPMFLAVNGNHNHQNIRYFCQQVGITVPEEDDDAWVIPADWTPAP